MAAKSGQVGGSTGKSVLAVALVAVAIAAAGLAVYLQRAPDEPVETAALPETDAPTADDLPQETGAEDTDVAAVAPAPAEDATEEPAASVQANPEEPAEGGADAPATPDAPGETAAVQPDSATGTTPAVLVPDTPALEAPSFDVVRVEPDGRALIAGRSSPGTRVEVSVDGTVIADTTADESGGFVALADLGRSDVPRALTLRALDGNGGEAASDGVVVLAPSPETVAEAEPEAREDETPDTEDATAEAVAEPAEAEPAAPSVIIADSDGVRVLQDGGAGTPEVADNVVIDAITYDETGEVALSGRAPGDGQVRVYVDNEPVEVGKIGPDGQWRAELPEVDTGVYTLRVDQVDQEGTVLSRIETPFQREAPEAIRALADASGDSRARRTIELVTVQPGNTLWGLSTSSYGEGRLFVRLFEANRDKIRDPDLIYPGQVFSIPN